MYRTASTLFATGALILARPSTAAGSKMPCASDAALTVEMPTVTPAGRSLLQIVWDELDVAQGDEKHLAVSAEKAIVGGVDYDTKCALLPKPRVVVSPEIPAVASLHRICPSPPVNSPLSCVNTCLTDDPLLCNCSRRD